jgi:two-component system, sporulation sensor kinase E
MWGILKVIKMGMTDLEYIKALEQQVIASERLSSIGKMAAGLAHEIRNPLTTVMGFLQIMRSNKDYTKAEAYIDVIYDELTRMKHLISDFVTLSKPSPPDILPVGVTSFLTSVIGLMESQSLLRGVQVDTDYAEISEDCLINIDTNQIKQVMMNIIQNAMEAMEGREGSVTVGCVYDKDAGNCCISVTDMGIGMNEEALDKVNTPFFTTKESGTGLGLSVCYTIIESHGGVIKVSSTVGVGTRFEINLPI